MELVEATPWMGDLVIKKYRLENGLRVFFLRDPGAPVFACHTWYDVGSRHERPGITGIAHLFEHLMFKETKNLAEGQFDVEMEAKGASTNAATYFDWTFYHQELKSEYLDFCLGLEADRMANMVLGPHQLETEREVVKNERLLRTENDPEGAMFEALHENAYTVHPYQWPVIGRKPDLDLISLEDCQEFYRSYYSPDNAVLVLVGDLDEEESLGLVQKHYGEIPASGVTHVDAPFEPEAPKEVRVEMVRPVASDMLLLGFHVPGFEHPDLPAIEVANSVLFDGPSSRLERRLGTELELAYRIEGWLAGTKDPGLWEFFFSLREDHAAAELEPVLYEELDHLGRDLISRRELERAKAKLESGFYRGLREATDKAYQIGFHEVVAGGVASLVQGGKRWTNVTREDVRRVARKYLARDNRVVVHTRPRALEAESQSPRGPMQRSFEGGAKGYLESSPDLPLVHFRVLFRAGSAADPVGSEGLTHLTIEALTRGTQKRNRAQFEEACDGIGASTQTYSGFLSSAFGGEVTRARFEPFMGLLQEAFHEPSFDPEEIRKLVDETRASIAETANDDGSLLIRALRGVVFPEHPFGRDPRGSMKSIESLDADQVRAHFDRLKRTGNLVFAAAGDLPPETFTGISAGFLRGVPHAEASFLPEPPPATPEGLKVLLVDKPERSQVTYALGHRGIHAGHPDQVALKLAETPYGVTFTSALMQALRVETGWTYGAYASQARSRLPDLFYQSAYPTDEVAPECIAKHLLLYRKFQKGEISDEALAAAKSYLVNRLPFQFETPLKRLNKTMEPDFLDLPKDYWAEYEARLDALEPDAVREAVRRNFEGKGLVLVAVCTAEGFLERLQAAGVEPSEVERASYLDVL